MDRALWLLLWLRLWGWERRLRRNLRGVKGAVLGLLGFAFFFACLFPALLAPRPPMSPDQLETVRLYGPLALLAYCVLSLILSTGERAVSFTPAEVNFLFAGPFSRRQLLAYKITAGLALSLFSAVVFLLAFPRSRMAVPGAAYLGMVLVLWFVQLFSMLLVLLATTVGAQVYNRRRRIVLVVLLVLAVAALVPFGNEAVRLPPGELLKVVAEAPALRLARAPLRPMVEVFTAERAWPDLVQWTMLGLLVNGALLGMVFAFDAHYLESAAAASERLYARLQQMRAGGAAALTLGSARKVRLGLPALPWWGGIGPIAWRQLVTAPRTRGPLLFLLILGVFLVGPILGASLSNRQGRAEEAVPLFLAATVLGMTVFLTPTIAFDFRADLDRMDILKSLPIAPFSLVLGQLVAPVLLLTVLQWLTLGVVAGVTGRVHAFFAFAAVLVLPFNVLLLGIENLLFLWFPTRLGAATPGDFQALGRNMLLMLAKSVGLALGGGMAALVGSLVFFLTRGSALAAGLTAWVVLMGCALALVPLIAWAFQQFDVSRDTPP